MRRGVVLAVLIGLVVAVPAAARQQAETVTVRVGQTVPLKTVFDKKKKYTIVMSGLVTRTMTDGSKLTYDPFFGAQAENCQRVGMALHLQIKDEHGRLLDSAATGRPSCRRDHRYEFQVNDGPLLPDLVGRATAYIAILAPTPGFTDSGSFTLQIKSPGRRDVVFKVLAKNELRASKKNELLADARLGGAGRIVDVGGLDRGRGVLSLTLVWLQRDDAHLVLRPVGDWVFSRKRMEVQGVADVVKSDEPRCPKGGKVRVRLLERPRSDARLAPLQGCKGLEPLYVWSEPASALAVNVREDSAGG